MRHGSLGLHNKEHVASENMLKDFSTCNYNHFKYIKYDVRNVWLICCDYYI